MSIRIKALFEALGVRHMLDVATSRAPTFQEQQARLRAWLAKNDESTSGRWISLPEPVYDALLTPHKAPCFECKGTGVEPHDEYKEEDSCCQCEGRLTVSWRFRVSGEDQCDVCFENKPCMLSNGGNLMCRVCLIAFHKAHCGFDLWDGGDT